MRNAKVRRTPRVFPPGWVPSYRRHKASGRAIVTLGGRVVYLGVYRTARAAYDRVVAEWLTAGRRSNHPPRSGGLPGSLTIADMFSRSGPTRRARTRRPRSAVSATRPAGSGGSAARPRRDGKPGEVEPHFCRRTINAHMARIRQIFKCAATQELMPAARYGLPKGGWLRETAQLLTHARLFHTRRERLKRGLQRRRLRTAARPKSGRDG
jgi:hypothetical protein